MLPNLEKLRISCIVMLLIGIGIAILVIRSLGGSAPQPPRLSSSSSQPDSPTQISGNDIRRIFSAPPSNTITMARKEANPFYTEHYVPPPEPAPQAEPQPKPPPSPEPTTETIELTYRGFFETPKGNRNAYVLVGDELKTVVVGSTLIGAWEVRTIEAQKLILTSPAPDDRKTDDRQARDSLEIPFNQTKTIEIPKSS